MDSSRPHERWGGAAGQPGRLRFLRIGVLRLAGGLVRDLSRPLLVTVVELEEQLVVFLDLAGSLGQGESRAVLRLRLVVLAEALVGNREVVVDTRVVGG